MPGALWVELSLLVERGRARRLSGRERKRSWTSPCGDPEPRGREARKEVHERYLSPALSCSGAPDRRRAHAAARKCRVSNSPKRGGRDSNPQPPDRQSATATNLS